MDKSLIIHRRIWKFEKSAICFEDSTLIRSVIKAHFNGNEKEKKKKGKYTLHIKVTK